MPNVFLENIGRKSDVLIGIGVVVILMVMLIPMPPFFIDFLLAVNFLVAFIILLSPIYILQPSEFSVYPGLLLVVTLFRLSLNVATTRLILLDGNPGKIIYAFGEFMLRGNYFVGIIIFLILFIINLTVITKGSGRVAEVAARFTLDAMPGKQMAIDADLNNGVIDDQEANKRRESIRRDADFYGAMDGAAKFVAGDAKAGIIITVLNIIGGIVSGMVFLKMPFVDALNKYTILTVGDGLVAQIPALLISTSAGLLVTRAGTKSNLGQEVFTQLFNEPKALFVASVVMFGFGFAGMFFGLPWYLFMGLSVLLAIFANMIRNAEKESNEKAMIKPDIPTKEEVEKAKEDVTSYLTVDPLELEIGYSLISLVDEKQNGDLLDRITSLRKQIAMEIGILVPPIRIRDNISLVPNHYVIKIRGEEISMGECLVNHSLALDPGTVEKPIKGIATKEPAFGLPAIWITEDKKDIAEMHGYTVVEPAAVIATHISEIIKSNADKIITRQDVQKLLDNIKKENEAVVKELVPAMLSLGQVEQVMKNLLHENVPVRDMVTILETLADYAASTRDTDILTEYVRYALARTISKKFIASDGVVHGITLAPQLEQQITNVVNQIKQKNYSAALPPDIITGLHKDLQTAIKEMNKKRLSPVIIVSPNVRAYIKTLIEPVLPSLSVISYNEIPTDLQINSAITIDSVKPKK